MLSKDFPKWQIVYYYFQVWSKNNGQEPIILQLILKKDFIPLCTFFKFYHIIGIKALQKNKGSINTLLAIDATETPIKELKKIKLLFSGKKKHPSLKSQIIIDIYTNKIISIYFCYGSIDDYKLFLKSNTCINSCKEIIADSGYQGLQKIHQKTLIPFKKK